MDIQIIHLLLLSLQIVVKTKHRLLLIYAAHPTVFYSRLDSAL